jgi:hypothetical protein
MAGVANMAAATNAAARRLDLIISFSIWQIRCPAGQITRRASGLRYFRARQPFFKFRITIARPVD